MQQALETFLNTIESTPSLLALDGALRYVFPLLALVILLRCGKSLLLFRREPEVWAWLAGPTGDRIPVMHWESLIGRGKGCDVTLEYPTISRTHAVLTRYDDGSWTIMDAGSTGACWSTESLRSWRSCSSGTCCPSAALILRSFPSRRSRNAFRRRREPAGQWCARG